MRAIFNACLAVLTLGLTAFTTPPPLPEDVSWLYALRHAMQRAADVEWRLTEAAGRICPAVASATGLVLDSRDSYGYIEQKAVVKALDLTDALQVAAVAVGSPAAVVGMQGGDDLLLVNGDPLISPQPNDKRPSAVRAMEALAELPSNTPTRITLRRAGRTFTASLLPKRQCAAHIFVDAKNDMDAYTDGASIIITARMVDFTRSEDELAILAGHELGHVIGKDGQERSIGERRRMEDRADLLGADLAACAEYNVKAAAPFWRRLEKQNILRFVAIRLQSSGQARARNITARPAPAACPINSVPPLPA